MTTENLEKFRKELNEKADIGGFYKSLGKPMHRMI